MTSSTPLGLEPIETVGVQELVYQRLLEALVSGAIAPNQKLTSRKLARELGTSDMPVRAALLKLQTLRALAALPNGSLVLPPMTRTRFADLMQTRQICEGAATELGTAHARRRDLIALKKEGAGLVEAARARDIKTYLMHNYRFKFTVYRLSQSPTLIFLIETLWLQVGPFLQQFSPQLGGYLEDILKIDYHEEILAAIERGDAVAARAAMVRDIVAGAELLLADGDFAPEP